MNLVDELFAVTRALHEAGVEYAVCGGIAVTIHGYKRFTDDIDLLVKKDDVPRILVLVAPLGFDVRADPMTFGGGTGAERHVQRVSKIDHGAIMTLDLLLAMASYEGLLEDRQELPLGAGALTVVSRSALLKMKRLAQRPQDLLDIEKLESGDEG